MKPTLKRIIEMTGVIIAVMLGVYAYESWIGGLAVAFLILIDELKDIKEAVKDGRKVQVCIHPVRHSDPEFIEKLIKEES